MLEQLYNGLLEDDNISISFEQFQNRFQNDPIYRQKLHSGIVQDGDFSGDYNTFENKFLAKPEKESTVVKDIDTSPEGLFFNVLQETQPGLARALSVMSSIGAGTLRVADSMANFVETTAELQLGGGQITGLPMYIAKRLAAQKAGVTKEEFDEKNPYNVVELEGIARVLDKAVIKHKDKETGQQLDFTELFERGEYGKAAESFVMETAGAAPSLIVSRLPGGYVMLGGGSFADKLNEDLFERPDQTAEKILSNALIYGGSDAVGEYFGGRYLNKLAGVVKGGGKPGLDRAKDVMVGGVGAFIKTIFKGGSSEAMQEAITSVIQTGGDDIIYGDEKTGSEYFRKALHAGLIGFALGGGSGSVSLGMNKKNKTNFYEYLAPKSYKNQQTGLFYKLQEAQEDLENAPADKKEKFQRRVDKIKKQQEDLREQMYNQFELMQKEDPKGFELMIEKIQEQHDALDIITGGKNYSESAKEQARKDFKEAADVVGDLFAVTDINYDSDIELELSKYFKVAEDIDKQNENLWFKAKDLDYSYVDNQEKFDELKKQYGAKVMNSAQGFFDILEDGKRKIFINRDVAAMESATNVIGHEILHYAMSHRFANDPKFLRESVVAFNKYLDEVNPYIKKSIEKRLANPKNGYAKLDADGKIQRDEDGLIIMNNDSWIEEYFTMFSDLIKNEKIDVVEEASAGIKNSFRTMARGLGLGFDKVDFKNGKEVFDLLIDYNKNIGRTGLLGKITQKKAVETVAGKKIKKAKAGLFMSKDASDNVQRIYNEQGEAGAMDIIEQFKPITSKIVERRSEAPNFDRQLLTDEIETGKRGIFDLIREYDPKSKVPLAAYINKFLPARAIEASKRVLGEEFTEDITEKVDIAAEEVTTEVKTKPKKKKVVLADRLGIVKEVDAAVAKIIPDLNLDKITFKNLKNQIPKITGKLFGISPKKLISGANITKGELQSSQMFINKNADLLINMLPEGSTQGGMATGVPNTLLKAFYTKTDRAKMAKTGTKAGLAIQQKNKISKEEFLEVFGIVDGKPNRTDRNTSARVLALANTLGKMITNQAVRQQVKTEGLRALEDGKSSIMFSKDKNEELVNKYPNINYYNTLDNAGAETYVVDLVEKVIPIFEPGFLNATVAITTSTMPNRLVKDAKSMLASYMGLKGVEFGSNKDFARTKFDTKLVRAKSDKEIQALNKRNMDSFEYMWMAIYDAVQKDKTVVTPLLHWLSGSVNEGTHPQRLGAELTHVDRTVKGKLYFEHALQNSNAYRLLMDAAISQNKTEFTKTLKALQDNYKLIAISAKDNTKINKAGYGLLMPEGWNIFDNNWWERYFNDKIAALGGINPENLRSIISEKTLGQELNIGIDGQPKITKSNLKQNQMFSKAVNKARTTLDPKGITVLDFDDTLATTKSLVKFTRPDGTTGTLNAEEYASTYEDLLDQGYTFDFSDFNKVVKGKLAPLFQKALKLQGKFGPENMFVLTARPPAAQKAIFDFLKANGLNIPLKNITGLGNSTAEAKALWIADKVGEGYNDFYFADDALQNVQAVKNMLDQFDVKSKVQQAKVKFSKSMNDDFNNILEEVTGIEAQKRFSDIKARKRGASKGKFRFFIPPSHEDFVGLLYNFMGKGRKGDQHRDFFEQALVRPLNRAYREIDTAKQAIANDYKELNKQFADVKKKLTKKTPDGDFIFEDAIRVYLWNKHGYDIPGLSPTDQNNLSELVMNDSSLRAYAETLNVISKQDKYVDPGQGWEGGSIKTDLIDATGRVGRAEYFAEFNENADVLFSPENLNKIEAAYGADFRSALEDMLHRISTGINRPKGQSGTVNKFMNYLNGSVGTVMFFNVRSAILQQMSIVNYINFADNNIFAAAKAFANQKQYWKDFAFIFNSDMLKQRRGGIGTDINGADLAQAVKGSKDPTKVVISRLLRLGFLPTQIGDNIAIATGGATFYRNRVNKYIKDGLSQKEAETKAFTDFQDLTQSTQQSSRPDMSSQQQSSWIGKLVLNFQNITSQYNRIIKKAASDIYNRRITPPYTTQTQSDLGNLSKILYYGGIQNVIFYSLQTALFAVMFDDDEDEEQILKKRERVIQGSIDSILRGAGIYGAIISTLKNTLRKFKEQRDKGYNKDESAVLMELLNFSPVVGIKARQIVNAEKTINYNENVISEMKTFDADNPQWSAVTNYTQALTNFPANRLYQKSINMRNALDKDYTNFQRVLFFSGYTTWSLGLGDNEAIIEAKEKVKINKANTKKRKTKSKGRKTRSVR